MTDHTSATEQLHLACVDATERLVDTLSVRGFKPLSNTPGTWRGQVLLDRDPEAGDVRTAIEVRIPSDYPFAQPKVRPLTKAAAETWLNEEVPAYHEASYTWHCEPGGYLCLFDQEDHTRLPWANADALLEQVRAWLREDRAGWPNDPPALDLERYLDPTGEVVLYDDLRPVNSNVVYLQRTRSGPWAIGRAAKVRRGRQGKKSPWPAGVALVLDIGELARPIRDWSSLLDAAGEQRRHLELEVGDGVRELVLAYRRADAVGVIALRLRRSGSGWTVAAHRAAPMNPEALSRRMHPDHVDLAERRVAVVGVGAIGSVLADLLHRSGVGHLHLIDPDLVLPGNLVRHLVGVNHVGVPKVRAVAETLRTARPGSMATVTPDHRRISSLEEACNLLGSCDLVVDASADSTASGLIAAAARAGAGRAISVCVLADGYAIRADHWPSPVAGDLAASVLPPVRPGEYEAGCSSPISTTPPAAAWEAAALGARHAIEALLGSTDVAGEERVLRSPEGKP